MCAEEELVSFSDVPILYSACHDITIDYSTSPGHMPGPLDWIGIFAYTDDTDATHSTNKRSGKGSNLTSPLAFQWVPTHRKRSKTKSGQSQWWSTTFPAKVIQGLESSSKSYYFAFVKKPREVLGRSQPFMIRDESLYTSGEDARSANVVSPTISWDEAWSIESPIDRCPEGCSSTDLSDIVVLSISPSKEAVKDRKDLVSASLKLASSEEFVVTGDEPIQVDDWDRDVFLQSIMSRPVTSSLPAQPPGTEANTVKHQSRYGTITQCYEEIPQDTVSTSSKSKKRKQRTSKSPQLEISIPHRYRPTSDTTEFFRQQTPSVNDTRTISNSAEKTPLLERLKFVNSQQKDTTEIDIKVTDYATVEKQTNKCKKKEKNKVMIEVIPEKIVPVPRPKVEINFNTTEDKASDFVNSKEKSIKKKKKDKSMTKAEKLTEEVIPTQPEDAVKKVMVEPKGNKTCTIATTAQMVSDQYPSNSEVVATDETTSLLKSDLKKDRKKQRKQARRESKQKDVESLIESNGAASNANTGDKSVTGFANETKNIDPNNNVIEVEINQKEVEKKGEEDELEMIEIADRKPAMSKKERRRMLKKQMKQQQKEAPEADADKSDESITVIEEPKNVAERGAIKEQGVMEVALLKAEASQAKKPEVVFGGNVTIVEDNKVETPVETPTKVSENSCFEKYALQKRKELMRRQKLKRKAKQRMLARKSPWTKLDFLNLSEPGNQLEEQMNECSEGMLHSTICTAQEQKEEVQLKLNQPCESSQMPFRVPACLLDVMDNLPQTVELNEEKAMARLTRAVARKCASSHTKNKLKQLDKKRSRLRLKQKQKSSPDNVVGRICQQFDLSHAEDEDSAQTPVDSSTVVCSNPLASLMSSTPQVQPPSVDVQPPNMCSAFWPGLSTTDTHDTTNTEQAVSGKSYANAVKEPTSTMWPKPDIARLFKVEQVSDVPKLQIDSSTPHLTTKTTSDKAPMPEDEQTKLSIVYEVPPKRAKKGKERLQHLFEKQEPSNEPKAQQKPIPKCLVEPLVNADDDAKSIHELFNASFSMTWPLPRFFSDSLDSLTRAYASMIQPDPVGPVATVLPEDVLCVKTPHAVCSSSPASAGFTSTADTREVEDNVPQNSPLDMTLASLLVENRELRDQRKRLEEQITMLKTSIRESSESHSSFASKKDPFDQTWMSLIDKLGDQLRSSAHVVMTLDAQLKITRDALQNEQKKVLKTKRKRQLMKKKLKDVINVLKKNRIALDNGVMKQLKKDDDEEEETSTPDEEEEEDNVRDDDNEEAGRTTLKARIPKENSMPRITLEPRNTNHPVGENTPFETLHRLARQEITPCSFCHANHIHHPSTYHARSSRHYPEENLQTDERDVFWFTGSTEQNPNGQRHAHTNQPTQSQPLEFGQGGQVSEVGLTPGAGQKTPLLPLPPYPPRSRSITPQGIRRRKSVSPHPDSKSQPEMPDSCNVQRQMPTIPKNSCKSEIERKRKAGPCQSEFNPRAEHKMFIQTDCTLESDLVSLVDAKRVSRKRKANTCNSNVNSNAGSENDENRTSKSVSFNNFRQITRNYTVDKVAGMYKNSDAPTASGSDYFYPAMRQAWTILSDISGRIKTNRSATSVYLEDDDEAEEVEEYEQPELSSKDLFSQDRRRRERLTKPIKQDFSFQKHPNAQIRDKKEKPQPFAPSSKMLKLSEQSCASRSAAAFGVAPNLDSFFRAAKEFSLVKPEAAKTSKSPPVPVKTSSQVPLENNKEEQHVEASGAELNDLHLL